MVEVEIRNFQSIDHLVLRIDWFTSIAGRSNLGKSSIIRAIKAALTGAAVDEYVRHDSHCLRVLKGTKTCKCACSVHLRSEGLDLFWEKGDAVNRYVFNGQDYTAVNRGTPDFLQDAFGPIKIGDDKVLIQVADQFRHSGGGPIFLLDETGAVVADVLSDVAQLDRINVASRLAEKDRRDFVAARKVRDKDVQELKERLQTYDGLDDVLSRARGVESEEQVLRAQSRKRDQLLTYRDFFLTIGRQLKTFMSLSHVVPPSIEPILEMYAYVLKLNAGLALVQRSKLLRDSVTRLQGVDDVVVVPIEPVRDLYGGVGKIRGWVAKLRVFRELFARFKQIEAVSAPEVQEVSDTSEKIIRLAVLRRRHTQLETTLGELEQAMAGAEHEFEQVKTELGAICPTCARPFDLGHEHAAAQ